MNIHLLVLAQVIVLYINGFRAVVIKPTDVPAEKGQNLNFTCDNYTQDRLWISTLSNGTNNNLVSAPTYSVVNISEAHLYISYSCGWKSNSPQNSNSNSNTFKIVPSNVIYNNSALSCPVDGTYYTCSVSGKGFGNLVIEWKVNDNTDVKVPALVTTNTTPVGLNTTAQSTYRPSGLKDVRKISCIAYFNTTMTNTWTKDCFINVSTATPSVLVATSSEYPLTSTASLPHTSTPSTNLLPSASPTSPTSSLMAGTSILINISSILPAVTLGLVIIIIIGCILVATVIALKHRRKKWRPDEEIPSSAFTSGLPPLQRQFAVMPSDATSATPEDVAPPGSSDGKSTSTYDEVHFPSQLPQTVATKNEDPTYAHLVHPMPQTLTQVEIYSQLKLDHRSSHSSLHSSPSTSSHQHNFSFQAQQRKADHCPSCHSSQSLCPRSPGHKSCGSMPSHHHTCCGGCCHGELLHHPSCSELCHHASCVELNTQPTHPSCGSSSCCSGHAHPSSCNRSCHGHTSRSGSVGCNEDEQTEMVTKSIPPPGHLTCTETVQPPSPLRATRPDYLPLLKLKPLNTTDTTSSTLTALPLHMKTVTNNRLSALPPHGMSRSKSLTTIVEAPTPAEHQPLELRTPTPMPPLPSKSQPAAFSTHDIPAIVLSSGTPIISLANPLPAPASVGAPSLLATVSHEAKTKAPLPHLEDHHVPPATEQPSAVGHLKPRRSVKEPWTLAKGSSASLNCEVSAAMGNRNLHAHSLPRCHSNSSHLQNSDARSDPGYETDRDMLNYKQVVAQKRLGNRVSSETLV